MGGATTQSQGGTCVCAAALQRRVAVRKFDSKCTRTALAKIDILLKGYLTVSSLHLSQRVHVSVGYCKTITSFIYFYLFITDEAAY